MITIEYREPFKDSCSCCGGLSTWLTRYVYQDDNAYAVYYASFTDKPHDYQRVLATISLGEWYKDEVPDSRVAFTVEIRRTLEQFEVEVLNADESLWQHKKILGRMLDCDEALAHPWLNDVFHITDHMVTEDPEIKLHFEIEEIQ